jgi:hypothetical protein
MSLSSAVLVPKGVGSPPSRIPSFHAEIDLCNPAQLCHLSLAQGGLLSAATAAIERAKDLTRMLDGSQTS